jgi:hypothetical protein
VLRLLHEEVGSTHDTHVLYARSKRENSYKLLAEMRDYYKGIGPIKIIKCIRKVAVHLQKVLEVMSTSVYTALNPFNFICKHFLQIYVRKVDVHL